MLRTFYPCSFPLRSSLDENFALIFIRSQGLNGGIMLPTFHTYFHSWSVWVCSRYERNISVTVGRQAIKMFPLAHAFVIIWWKFTASADVSTGKIIAASRKEGSRRWNYRRACICNESMERNVLRFVFAWCSNVTFLNKQIFPPKSERFEIISTARLARARTWPEYCEYHHMRFAEDVTVVR